MNNYAAHQKLVDDILFLFGSDPKFRIFPRRNGLAKPINSDRTIMFGIKGEPDLMGFTSPRGHLFYIEIKTGSGKLTSEQKKFRDMAIGFGVSYLECHTLDQAIEFKKNLST